MAGAAVYLNVVEAAGVTQRKPPLALPGSGSHIAGKRLPARRRLKITAFTKANYATNDAYIHGLSTSRRCASLARSSLAAVLSGESLRADALGAVARMRNTAVLALRRRTLVWNNRGFWRTLSYHRKFCE